MSLLCILTSSARLTGCQSELTSFTNSDFFPNRSMFVEVEKNTDSFFWNKISAAKALRRHEAFENICSVTPELCRVLSVWSGRCGNDNSVMAALLMRCSSEEIFCETRRGPHHNHRLLTWLPVVPLQWRPFGPWHPVPLVLCVVESKELVFAHHLDLHPSGTFVTSAFKCPSSTVVSSKGFSTILNCSYLPRFLCNRFSPSLKSIFSFPLTFS